MTTEWKNKTCIRIECGIKFGTIRSIKDIDGVTVTVMILIDCIWSWFRSFLL